MLIYNEFLFFAMPFEYRIMTEAIKALETYNQLDLYFFKPKLSSVGIKVRMSNRKSELWDCDDLQLKYIKNTKDIESKLTVLQDWKKIHMPVEFQIYAKEHIVKNAQKFGINAMNPLQTVISHQLQKLNMKICEAIMHADIKEKHFEKNPDLANWVNPQYPITEIFAVQKSKLKSFTHEKGQFKVYPLYGTNIAATVWDTFGFEAHSEKSLRKILNQSGQEIKENISYPKILERIYFK